MKSWWLKDTDAGAVLELRDVPLPEPKAGQLRVRVRACALNRGEFLRAPSYHASADARPAGADCAGEVDAIGPGVTGWSIADRVMGTAQGAYSEYALLDASLAMPAPKRLSWEEAASVPIVFIVTYDMLWTNAALKAGEWLLVTGVTSGVGVASLLAAKYLGAKVIGTSGSRAKLERLKALGLDIALETRKPDFAAAVLEATGGKGADVVVNNVGGTVFAECMKCMAHGARLATVGYLDKTFRAEIDLNALHAKRFHLFGVSNRYRPIEHRAENVRRLRKDLLPAFEQGGIKPLVDKVFPLDQLQAAKAYMEADAQVGKIVLVT
jgi:NADPH:quinone reductase